jgi:hypothetical protein
MNRFYPSVKRLLALRKKAVDLPEATIGNVAFLIGFESRPLGPESDALYT